MNGERDVLTVIGMTQLRGHDVFVIEYSNSTYNNGLRNFWTNESDGDVLLWGFRESDGSGFLYDPPIRMVDAPLSLGRSWTSATTVSSDPDTIPHSDVTFLFEVYEAGVLDVPAGSFYAYGVGYTQAGYIRTAEIPATRGVFDILGRVPGSSRANRTVASNATDWWSENIGELQYLSTDTYQLSSFDAPTPARVVSWGGIKSRFR